MAYRDSLYILTNRGLRFRIMKVLGLEGKGIKVFEVLLYIYIYIDYWSNK